MCTHACTQHAQTCTRMHTTHTCTQYACAHMHVHTCTRALTRHAQGSLRAWQKHTQAVGGTGLRAPAAPPAGQGHAGRSALRRGGMFPAQSLLASAASLSSVPLVLGAVLAPAQVPVFPGDPRHLRCGTSCASRESGWPWCPGACPSSPAKTALRLVGLAPLPTHPRSPRAPTRELGWALLGFTRRMCIPCLLGAENLKSPVTVGEREPQHVIHRLKSAFPQVGRGGEKGRGEEGGCSTRVRKRKPDLTEGGEPHSGCVVPISPRLFTKMALYGCIPQATEANEKLFEEKSSQELKEFQPNTLAKQTNRQLMTTGQKNKGN